MRFEHGSGVHFPENEHDREDNGMWDVKAGAAHGAFQANRLPWIGFRMSLSSMVFTNIRIDPS